MEWWWQRMVVPVKRALVAVAARVRAGKDGGGMLIKLHDEVQTCGYEDVQVMWEMLQRSATELAGAPNSKQSPSCRGTAPVWSRRISSSSSARPLGSSTTGGYKQRRVPCKQIVV